MDNKLRPPSRQGPERPCRGSGPWLKLAAGVGIILLFMLLVGPVGLRLPGYSEMARLVDEQNIRANAIYYTDLEEFARSDAAVKDSLTYPPTQTPKPTVPASPRP